MRISLLVNKNLGYPGYACKLNFVNLRCRVCLSGYKYIHDRQRRYISKVIDLGAPTNINRVGHVTLTLQVREITFNRHYVVI